MNRGRFLVNLALNNAEYNKVCVPTWNMKASQKCVPTEDNNTDNNLQIHKASNLPILTEDNYEIRSMTYALNEGKHFVSKLK